MKLERGLSSFGSDLDKAVTLFFSTNSPLSCHVDDRRHLMNVAMWQFVNLSICLLRSWCRSNHRNCWNWNADDTDGKNLHGFFLIRLAKMDRHRFVSTIFFLFRKWLSSPAGKKLSTSATQHLSTTKFWRHLTGFDPVWLEMTIFLLFTRVLFDTCSNRIRKKGEFSEQMFHQCGRIPKKQLIGNNNNEQKKKMVFLHHSFKKIIFL